MHVERFLVHYWGSFRVPHIPFIQRGDMIRWFIVDDKFTYQNRMVEIDICLCDEREEGYRICDTCFMEHVHWQLWMRKANERRFC